MMAIRVLLDHDVEESKIIFLCFLAAPPGLQALVAAFPKVRIVTSAVDPSLAVENLYIIPGIGNFAGISLNFRDYQAWGRSIFWNRIKLILLITSLVQQPMSRS